MAFQCNFCNFLGKQERDLRRHSRLHQLKCPKCSQRFPTVQLILEHHIRCQVSDASTQTSPVVLTTRTQLERDNRRREHSFREPASRKRESSRPLASSSVGQKYSVANCQLLIVYLLFFGFYDLRLRFYSFNSFSTILSSKHTQICLSWPKSKIVIAEKGTLH